MFLSNSLLRSQTQWFLFSCLALGCCEPQGWAALMGVGFGGFLSGDGAGGNKERGWQHGRRCRAHHKETQMDVNGWTAWNGIKNIQPTESALCWNFVYKYHNQSCCVLCTWKPPLWIPGTRRKSLPSFLETWMVARQPWPVWHHRPRRHLFNPLCCVSSKAGWAQPLSWRGSVGCCRRWGNAQGRDAPRRPIVCNDIFCILNYLWLPGSSPACHPPEFYLNNVCQVKPQLDSRQGPAPHWGPPKPTGRSISTTC